MALSAGYATSRTDASSWSNLTDAGRNILQPLTAEEREFDQSTGLSDPNLRVALENIIIALRPTPSTSTQKKTDLDVLDAVPLLTVIR